MKRGNTALKRVVSVTSVAAMAIAGAVLAAPAANADLPAAAAAVVRAKPIANADQIGSDGNKLAAPTGLGTKYTSASGPVSSGNIDTIQAGSKNQHVSDLQILIPGDGASLTAWDKTKPITVTLPTGVTVNGTPVAVAAAKAVTIADADALAVPAADGVDITNAGSIGVDTSVAGIIKLTPANDLTTAANLPPAEGVLVTVSGIYVDVADSFTNVYGGAPGANAVTATVAGTAALGVTTLAYVSSLALSAAGTYPANAKTVALPDVTLTELSKAGFSAANTTVTLKLTTDPAGSPTAASLVTGAATVKTKGSTTIEGSTTIAANAAGTTVTLAFPTSQTDTSALESVTISGLKATNVPAGSKVALTVSAPTGVAATNAGLSSSPNQSTYASVTIASEVSAPRIAGDNRYATAADIAKAGTWGRTAVVLANGTDIKAGVDALSANFLAGATKSPILLTTNGATLPSDTQLALTRLFSGQGGTLTIYVMGKSDSVSEAARASAKAIVEAAALSSATVKVQEVAGDDRYATSAAAVNAGKSGLKAYDLGAGTLRTAFLASGVNNADALSAGAVSAGLGIPVLLVKDGADKVSDAVAKAITDQHIGQIIILGDTDRASEAAEKALKDSGVKTIRVKGADRYATSAAINTLVFKASTAGLGQVTAGKTVYLANGAGGFADALAVGPFAGQQNNVSPLVTVQKEVLSADATTFLKAHTDLNAVKALGQSDRIADSVVTAAQQAIIPAS